MKRALLLLTGLLCFSVIGCSKGGAKTDGGTVTLSMWSWDSIIHDLAAKAFTATHPNIEFEVVPVSAGEVPEKLQQSLAAGLPLPDIIHAEIDVRARIFDMDISEDLGKPPYNLTGNEFFDFVKPLITNSKGQISAVDVSVFPAAFAYKKDLTLKYFGTDDRAKLEAMFNSLDAFVQRGAELNKASGGTVFLFASPGEVIQFIQLTSGTKLVNSDGSLNYSTIMRPALEFLINLKDVGAVNTLVPDSPQYNASFADANHIFYPCATWVIPYRIVLNDPNGKDRWGLIMPPTGPFAWGGITQGISKTSKNKEAAWEFLRWCNFEQEGVDVLRQNSYYTTVKSFYTDTEFTSNKDPNFGDLDIGNFFYQEMAPKIVPPDVTPYNQIVKDLFNTVGAYVMADRNVTLDMAVSMGLAEMRSRLPDLTIN